MSKALQEKIYCTGRMDMYIFLGTLILVMSVLRVIENLLEDITLLLEETL